MADTRVTSADRVRKRLEQFRAQRQDQPASSAVATASATNVTANTSRSNAEDATGTDDEQRDDVGMRGDKTTQTETTADLQWCAPPHQPPP
jgi:hypothetical protein